MLIRCALELLVFVHVFYLGFGLKMLAVNHPKHPVQNYRGRQEQTGYHQYTQL